MRKIGFRQFIATRHCTDNPRGDFIRDAKGETDLPDAESWDELKSYLLSKTNGSLDSAVEEAAREVWTQYARQS